VIPFKLQSRMWKDRGGKKFAWRLAPEIPVWAPGAQGGGYKEDKTIVTEIINFGDPMFRHVAPVAYFADDYEKKLKPVLCIRVERRNWAFVLRCGPVSANLCSSRNVSACCQRDGAHRRGRLDRDVRLGSRCV
jgi:hypothetical protein